MPKLIHVIWFHGSPPSMYKFNIKRCMDLNPDWELKVWTMKNISKLDLNEELFERFKEMRNKYEILVLADLVKYVLN